MNSKQRASLRRIANRIDTIIQIGKADVTENILKQAEEALTARQLIKLRVLDTASLSAHQAAELIAETLKAEVVQIIGTPFVLYRPNDEGQKLLQ